MRRTLVASARPLSAALAVVLFFAWSAPPAAAGSSKASPTRTSLTRAVDAKVASLKPGTRAFQTTTATTTSSSDRSFLRSPVGVVAIVAMAAGLAYAVKTAFKDNDAVHSPVR